MEVLQQFYEELYLFLPSGIALLSLILITFGIRFIIRKKSSGVSEHHFRRQVITLIVSFAGLIVIILLLPIGDSSRGQLLSLLGLLVTAAIALSATTLIGNIMAGIMLRAVRNFKSGDFIRIGEHFGRVSERGLFHIEIQVEDRDLITLPNLYLVTNPVKVIRASGTIISAEVSLGYDIPHDRIKSVLLQAAEAAGLDDSFVQIMELGDFSVTYRTAGMLSNTKHILTTRSDLREQILTKCHENNIEIVSPTFMNTRAMAPGKRIIPKTVHKTATEDSDKNDVKPEAIVFDKAEEAETLEKLKETYEALGEKFEQAKEDYQPADDPLEEERHQARMDGMEARRKRIAFLIKKKEDEKENNS